MISERPSQQPITTPTLDSSGAKPSATAPVVEPRPNLLDPEVRANPYPLYERLRREAPVCQVEPGGFWAISRYDDIVAAFKNHKVFSNVGIRAAGEPAWLGRLNPICESMMVMDPPQHGRLKALVNRAFGATTMARLEPLIRNSSEELVNKMLERRHVDFVSEFALPLPAAVIGELLGLDASLQTHFKRWSDDLIAIPAIAPDDVERQVRARASVDEMEQYLTEVLESRRRQRGDDLVSELIHAQVDGESLTQQELMGFCFLLLLAGMETTVYLLGFCAQLLADRPDLMARLRTDLSLVPRFVEEVLRYEPPLHTTLRTTTAEVEVSGSRIPAGSMVLLIKASALRDEAYFPQGEHFDIDRTGNSNMAFGHGVHYCLGALLARMEARIAMETLLRRTSAIIRPSEPIELCHSLTMRGPLKLPLEVVPA